MADSISDILMQGYQAGARYRLVPPQRAPQGLAGSQLGRLAGESMEFMDHREYQPGDDLRRLDWAAYARSDKMIVKLYRQEVCPHVDIVLDGSRSMNLRDTQKHRAAAGLAAAFTAAAGNSGYSHRAYITGSGCRPIVNGDEPPTVWQSLTFDATESPDESFRLLPPTWRPRGIRILISDLLWLGDPLELLMEVGNRAAAVYVVQVLASDDVSPPDRGNLRLVDSETGLVEELFIDAAMQTRYRNNLNRHCDNWSRAAKQVGAVFQQVVAEPLCANWDLSSLVESGIFTV